jgi:hypothetical protein
MNGVKGRLLNHRAKMLAGYVVLLDGGCVIPKEGAREISVLLVRRITRDSGRRNDTWRCSGRGGVVIHCSCIGHFS